MEGRLTDVTQSLNGSEAYEYDGANHRVWTLQPTGEVFWFYGPDGKRLMKCTLGVAPAPYGWGGLWITTKWPITYFLGQVVSGEGGTTFEGVAADRLGSVRQAPSALSWWSVANTSSYFPYGQARTGGSTWATYQPSTISATMYAMNREYSAVYGRFLTPDPYMASGGPADPESWNRYSYVQGDPVNFGDPAGLMQLQPCAAGQTRVPGNVACVPYAPVPVDETWQVTMNLQAKSVAAYDDIRGRNAATGNKALREAAYKIVSQAIDDVSASKLDRPECQKDLAALGVTASDLTNAVGKLGFLDGTTSQVKVSTVSNITNANGQTVSDYMAANNATTLAGTKNNTLYLDPGEWAEKSRWGAFGTVLHEGLHFLGMSDRDIGVALFGGAKTDTSIYSQKLSEDCVK